MESFCSQAVSGSGNSFSPLAGIKFVESKHLGAQVCNGQLSFSPLAGIKFVESTIGYSTELDDSPVSVPLRGLSSWKAWLLVGSMIVAFGLFQSPCGD